MADYEAASLALQEVVALTAVAGIVVGFVQCALIWAGLRMMRRAADRRDVVTDQQCQADERRHAEAMAAHAETMTALADQTARSKSSSNAPRRIPGSANDRNGFPDTRPICKAGGGAVRVQRKSPRGRFSA